MINNIKFNPKYNARKRYFETPYELEYLLNDNYLNQILDAYFNYLTANLNKENTHISLITRVETTEYELYTLGNKVVIDLENKEDILNYIELVNAKFNEHFHTSQHYDPLFISKLIFVHNFASKNTYTDFNRRVNRHNSLLLDKQISKGIVDKFNLPFDIGYESWGDVQYISSSTIKITNVYFNENIDCITVNTLGSARSSLNKINILFNDKSQVNLSDKIQIDGYIKRVYYDSTGKTDYIYTFNPILGVADFFINKNKLPKLYSKDKEGNEDLSRRLHIIKKVLNYDDLRRKVYNLQNKFPYSNIPDFEIPNFKAITLDVETYLTSFKDSNGNICEKHNLLSICFFDGINAYQFYKTDYNSIDEMLNSCFDLIFDKKYKDHTIYIHNGAKFDLVFLMNYLLNREDVTIGDDVIYKNGKFIQIILSKKFNVLEKGKERVIRAQYRINDSYLILNNSLAKLGKSFNVETQKDVFPYTFVNENNLNYIGEVPSFNFFEGLMSFEEYTNYSKKYISGWNLRTENLEYCTKDCISLYQILSEFKTLIDNKFNVNIQDCPTLTSIAFKIFKANYYNINESPIPSLTREIYNDLHNAFQGGHVDMYIPEGPSSNGSYQDVMEKYNKMEDKSVENVKNNFDLINHYDINSLYPSQMNSNKYPTDMICEFIGDITQNNEFKNLYDDNVGIYKVRMYGPDIEHPIMPVKINGSTIFGKGEWIGWYYSEELKNSEKYGYKFNILGGYVFESKNIFDEYINDLYRIKQSSSKGSAMYLISKLLMNSLYGRFGLNTFLPSACFISNDEYEKKVDDKLIDSVEVLTKDFENHVLVVTPNKSKEYCAIDGNVAVALAITANSRIRMCEVKNNADYKLLYSDTDSAFIEGTLPNESIDNKKLGYWSLENQYIYSVFIGPKTYACLDIYGKAYSKIKGYSSPVSISEFEKILNENVLKTPLTQKKWRSFITESKLIVNTTSYDLVATENKRNLVYDENNRLCGTTSKTIKIVDSKNILE